MSCEHGIGIDFHEILRHSNAVINLRCLKVSLIGNAVRIGDRPSAVIGDESCIVSLFG